MDPEVPPIARNDRSTAWMDVARVVAMVLVVLDHAVINGLTPLLDSETADIRWWLAEALLAVSRLAVPIFIMVSGALLLDPARTESFGRFTRRRLQRVGVPLLFWAVAYLVFRDSVLDEPLTASTAVRSFLAGNPYYHLYYLYIALGLYALTPFLRRLIAAADRSTVEILCAAALTLGIVDQFLRTVLQIGSSNGITLFVDYVGFYLAGWLLRDAGQRTRSAGNAAATLIAALAVVVLAAAALIDLGQSEHWFYPTTYLSPAVIVASVALFILLQHARPGPRTAPALRRIAELALGTYLVHPMVLDLIRQRHTLAPGVDGLAAWVFGLTAAGLLAGMAITFVARLIPVVRRVF